MEVISSNTKVSFVTDGQMSSFDVLGVNARADAEVIGVIGGCIVINCLYTYYWSHKFPQINWCRSNIMHVSRISPLVAGSLYFKWMP